MKCNNVLFLRGEKEIEVTSSRTYVNFTVNTNSDQLEKKKLIKKIERVKFFENHWHGFNYLLTNEPLLSAFEYVH